MKRLFSNLRFALPVAALLATTALVSTPAKAWEQGWQSSDGSVSLWYEHGSDGQTKFAVVIEKDGKYGVYFEQGVIDAVFDKIGGSNPDPNDPNNGQGTFKPDIKELLKDAKGINVKVKAELWDTWLGEYLSRGGDGKGPKWNPGPDDDGSPNTGTGGNHKPEGPTAKEILARQKAINVAVRNIENMKGGMYDGSEGGTEGPPSVGPKSGHGQGNGNDDDKSPDKPDDNVKNELGPKPELVNPPYFRTGKGKTGGAEIKKGKVAVVDTKGKSAGKAEGKSGGGKTAPMSPGLLDSGPGLGANGPSAAGSPASGGMGVAPIRGVSARMR